LNTKVLIVFQQQTQLIDFLNESMAIKQKQGKSLIENIDKFHCFDWLSEAKKIKSIFQLRQSTD